jgi:lipopolysaccharide transport system permease protein
VIYSTELIWHLVQRDFQLSHVGSVFGVGWRILIPLAQLGLLVLVFGSVVPLDIQDYPAFIYSALLPWLWFNNSLSSSAHLFLGNRDLLRRPNFSPVVLVIANMFSTLITFVLSFPLLLFLLSWYGRPITGTVLWFPLIVLVQGLLIFGLSLIIATYNVFYRDIAHVVSIVLPMLFFITPVFYRPVAEVEYSTWFQLNPMTALVRAYRAIFFHGTMPEWGTVMLVAILSLALLWLSYTAYRNRLPDIIDVL